MVNRKIVGAPLHETIDTPNNLRPSASPSTPSTPTIYLLELMYGHTQFLIQIDQNRFKFTVLGGRSHFCPTPLLILPPPDRKTIKTPVLTLNPPPSNPSKNVETPKYTTFLFKDFFQVQTFPLNKKIIKRALMY